MPETMQYPGQSFPSIDTRVALRVLVIGGGGRDHALCHAFASSPLLGELHAAPGNVGIADIAACHPVDLEDHDGMLAIAQRIRPDLVIVGAEDLLVAGLASRFEDAGFACVGPSRAAAQLEGSKLFSKVLMERAGVPTPPWRACSDRPTADAAVEALWGGDDGRGVAVKADGLAAGCGAFVCTTRDAARVALDILMVERRFGASGDAVIVESLVDGEEASVMAIVDGVTLVPLPVARDYKRLADHDSGPNTGGMGSHAPSTEITAREAAELARTYIQPVIDLMAADGVPFRGVVYAGVMLTSEGPRVLEYNCRFGNPETQSLVRVIDGDLLDLLHRTTYEGLAAVELGDGAAIAARGSAVAVCVAASNYPDMQLEPAPVLVSGLDEARAVEGVELFIGLADGVAGAGTDAISALGGRVVTVSAWGADLAVARERAYEAASHVRLEGRQLRSDIGRVAVTAGS